MKIFLVSLCMLTAPLFLMGNTTAAIEKKLQQSAPGLPQFRIFSDPFGGVRAIRTLPGEKYSGVFSLAKIKQYSGVSLLALNGFKELDLSGLSDFKALRSLAAGAEKLKTGPGTSSASVMRIDLSGSRIKDISWLKNFPALRIVYLPETVTDITVLKGRKLRSLSAPGVKDLFNVCLKLGITLQIRPEGFQRMTFRRHALPPVKLQRSSDGKVISAEFWRFRHHRQLNTGFVGKMFPEELEPFALQQVPRESYPGLHKFNRRTPFRLSAFNADSKTLQKLDLRALHSVIINGESFPELRELHLSGSISGLETLKAPKLTRLYLEHVESFDPASPITSPPSFRTASRNKRANLPAVALPAGLSLQTLKIIPRRDEFDFNSLGKVRFSNLECFYYGKSLDFLKGQKLVSLKISAPSVTGKGFDILRSIDSLKELQIFSGNDTDYSFLRSLKLVHLSLSTHYCKSFSPDFIARMPLRSLALHLPGQKNKVNWNRLRFQKLQELILSGITFHDPSFISRFPDLKSLALENCMYIPSAARQTDIDLEYRCASRIIDRIIMLKKLKNLRLGRIGLFDWNRLANMDLPLEKLSVLKLENMSVCTDIADWGREFKHLKRLKIDDISKTGLVPDQLRFDHQLKVLSLTNIRPRADRSVPDTRALFRRPVVPAPRKIEGIAEKVYIDVPGGFRDVFMPTTPKRRL